MFRWKILSLIILSLILLTPACTRQSAQGDQASNLTVDLSFEPETPVMGEGIILLKIWDEQTQPIEDLSIEVKGDMTHAGMTPVFGTSSYQGDGIYRVPFKWTMAGDWILQVTAELPDGRILDRSFDVRVASE
ncbi:MAG: FixH family protein [Anaerolineales bacterium]|jgi:hypothetical protein